MMQPGIGENHPRAVYPVDPIKPNQRWRKTRQRFGTLKAQANYTDGYGALVLIQLQ